MSQFEKLEYLNSLISEFSSSNEFVNKLALITIEAGFADYYAIQLARALEQCIIKYQIHVGKKFQAPHGDDFFYDEKISTRKVLNIIQKEILNQLVDENIVNRISKYLKCAHKFLDERNIVLHNTGDPKYSKEDIILSVEKYNKLFTEMIKEHSLAMEQLAPYTLTEDQRKLVYGDISREG